MKISSSINKSPVYIVLLQNLGTEILGVFKEIAGAKKAIDEHMAAYPVMQLYNYVVDEYELK